MKYENFKMNNRKEMNQINLLNWFFIFQIWFNLWSYKISLLQSRIKLSFIIGVQTRAGKPKQLTKGTKRGGGGGSIRGKAFKPLTRNYSKGQSRGREKEGKNGVQDGSKGVYCWKYIELELKDSLLSTLKRGWEDYKERGDHICHHPKDRREIRSCNSQTLGRGEGRIAMLIGH